MCAFGGKADINFDALPLRGSPFLVPVGYKGDFAQGTFIGAMGERRGCYSFTRG